MSEDFIDTYDKTVASAFAIMGAALFKTIEGVVELSAEEWVTVVVLGLDISTIAAYYLLLSTVTNALLVWKSIEN